MQEMTQSQKIRVEALRLAIKSFGEKGVTIAYAQNNELTSRTDRFEKYITSGYFK